MKKKSFLCIAIVFTMLRFSFAQITFSELNYNSDSTRNSGNWVELLNNGATAVDISNWILKDDNDLHSFKIPVGTILQAGGRIVVVNDTAKFKTEYPFIPFKGEMTFSFGNSTDQVRLFDNFGNPKVFMAYADTLPWSSAADGIGRTLEILDATQDPNNGANWFTGCMFGSPGYAYTPCNEPLVFDEINYNSDTLLDAGDWVELWNRSTGYINLTKYSFKDSHDTNIYNFPINLQIAPDSRLVLVHDSAKFFARHPNVTNWIGPFDFNLSNGGETLRLFDFNGQIKYSMIYKDQSSWPAGADGGGYTLELLDATKNVNVASDWFIGCLEGSPGYAYNPNCNVGINEIQQSDLFTVNNLSGSLFQIKSTQDIFSSQISIFNLLGNRIYTSVFNGTEMQVDLSNEAKGIYFIQIQNKSSFTTLKIIVQ